MRLRSSRAALALVAAGLMLIGIAPRIPADSLRELVSYIGSYSDASAFFFEHHFALHRAPYFDYPLEYPVLTGGLIWLVGFIHSSVTAYLLATAAVLLACGLMSVLLLDSLPGTRPWLFVLSPALMLYGVLNWDLFGIALMLGALVLFHRRRNGWAGAVLALAVWAKFFPILLLPLVLLVRIAERRLRDAAILAATFIATSVVVNAPVALRPAAHGGGLVVRKAWLYFFTFNQARSPIRPCISCRGSLGVGVNLWGLIGPIQLSTTMVNELSALLLAVGVVAVGIATWRLVPLSGEAVYAPALLALFAWFFFINKVYSPQYGLWIVALLALAGAPVALTAAFAAVDVSYFLATFGALAGNSVAKDLFLAAGRLRELMILGIVVWAVRRLAGLGRASPRTG